MAPCPRRATPPPTHPPHHHHHHHHHGTPRAQGQADKHLAQLAEAGKIAFKENGKSKIYWADQSGVAELSAQDLQQINFQSGSLKAERERLAQQVGELQRSLKVQGARKSKAQLLAERSKLEADVAAAEAELQRQKGPAKAALSTHEAEKVKKLYVMLHKEFRERKRKCVDVIDMLCEQTGDRSGAASNVPPPGCWEGPPEAARRCEEVPPEGCRLLVQKGAPAARWLQAACGAAATAAHVAAPDPAGPKKMAEDLGLELDEDNGVDFKKMPRVV